jgi:hypothetical protein
MTASPAPKTTASPAPKLHDTKSPLTCCPRCHKAELLGRLRRRPEFRYAKLEAIHEPALYDLYHGDQHVATLSRRSSPTSRYEVRVTAPTGGPELQAGTLRDARTLAEETYTASWREGLQTARGPVREI